MTTSPENILGALHARLSALLPVEGAASLQAAVFPVVLYFVTADPPG